MSQDGSKGVHFLDRFAQLFSLGAFAIFTAVWLDFFFDLNWFSLRAIEAAVGLMFVGQLLYLQLASQRTADSNQQTYWKKRIQDRADDLDDAELAVLREIVLSNNHAIRVARHDPAVCSLVNAGILIPIDAVDHPQQEFRVVEISPLAEKFLFTELERAERLESLPRPEWATSEIPQPQSAT